MKPLMTALALCISFMFIASLFAPLHFVSAGPTYINLSNGVGTYRLYASGFMDESYLNGYNDDQYAAYFEIAYNAGSGMTVVGPSSYAQKDWTLAVIQNWVTNPDGSAWAVAQGNVVGVVQKVAMVKGFGVLVWGVRIVNLGSTPLTSVRIVGHQDADFDNGDEGHYVALNVGPLKSLTYENNYQFPTSEPFYGFTFANLAPIGHDWVGYSPGYYDAYAGIMNNVDHYIGDGGGSTFYNLPTIPVGGSATFYWVYAMTPGNWGQAGLMKLMVLGCVSTSIATPPPYTWPD